MQIVKDKRLYNEFATAQDFPVYAQAWYLDALLGDGAWEVLLVLSKEDDILASFAFPSASGRFKSIKNRPGLPYLYLHISRPVSEKRHKRYRSEQQLIRLLMDNMPSYVLLDMELYPTEVSPLSFSMLGHKVQYRMTYTFRDVSDSTLLFKELESANRGHIRKAESCLSVVDSSDYHTFYEGLSAHFKRKGLVFHLKADDFIRLCKRLEKRSFLQVRLAKDQDGIVHGGQFRILDNTMIRLCFSFISDEGKSSRASYLLIWDLMKKACETAKSIDLEGSMAPSVEQFYRSFGAEQHTYFRVSYCKSFLLSMALEAKRLLLRP